MIVRPKEGRARHTKSDAPYQRSFDDPDLHWTNEEHHSEHRVYILAENEYFDPQTSSHGRHMMHGPAFISCSMNHGMMNTVEHHVNDPRMWAWVRRCIKQGYLNPENIQGVCDENDVEVVEL